MTAGTTTLGYDGAGNQTSVADPLGRITTSQFDAQNRPTSTTDPRGAVTQFAFDAAGRRISLTDPVNNTTSWGFDAADRVISETDPLANSRSYVWNAASEVTSYTDRNGRQSSIAYDNMGRKKTEQWLDGAGQPIHTISHSWDAASQLTNLSDAFSVYAFGYNAAGWLTSENNSGTPGMPQMTLTHGYDAFGMRISRTDNLGGSTSISFNARHLWTGSTLTVGSSSAAVTATYDSADRLARISRGGNQITTDLAYDNMDRVTRISHKNMQNQAISTFDYGYNSASEVTSYTGPEGSLAYSYDTAGELIGVSGARSESYSHDLNGNRTMAGYQTGTGNRLTSDGVFNYTYDNEGNLVTRVRISNGERTEFTWDHRNRMTKALVKNSAGTVLREVRFTYDALDRQIGRWYDADGAGPGVATQRWTVFDGPNPYADFLGSTLDDRYLYAPAVDAVMARLSSSGVAEWYLTDLLGSVRQIVNGMGIVQDAITYDSYGKILSETNPSVGDRFKFTAREWETAIDQYFYRARWQDPAIGRFTSIDPIGFEGGDANLYRYVGNAPTMFTDPSGLQGFISSLWNRWYLNVGVMVQHPVAAMGGYYQGLWHGIVMNANAATYNLPPPSFFVQPFAHIAPWAPIVVNHYFPSFGHPFQGYVNQLVQQHGLPYQIANWSSHIGMQALAWATMARMASLGRILGGGPCFVAGTEVVIANSDEPAQTSQIVVTAGAMENSKWPYWQSMVGLGLLGTLLADRRPRQRDCARMVRGGGTARRQQPHRQPAAGSQDARQIGWAQSRRNKYHDAAIEEWCAFDWETLGIDFQTSAIPPAAPRSSDRSVSRTHRTKSLPRECAREASPIFAQTSKAHGGARPSSRRFGIVWLAACLLLAAYLGFRPQPTTDGSIGAVAVSEEAKHHRNTKTIENVRVGDRVVGYNPDRTEVDAAAETAVDPERWKLLRLRAENRWDDGTLSNIEIETLRPSDRIIAEGLHVGSIVPLPLDLQEMGLPEDLRAEVVAVESCPPISAGPGHVVLTTINSLSNSVLELTLHDEARQIELLRPTERHKFYSEIRQEWISASDLRVGETLRGLGGPLTVRQISAVPGIFRVYNMTVETEHVYHVSSLGVLAHNACGGGVMPQPPGTPVPTPNFIVPRNGPPIPIPAGFQGRVTNNGRGLVFSPPGTPPGSNASNVRIMVSTPPGNPLYPNGHVIYYNALGQGLNPATGQPGSRAQMHIPVNHIGPLPNYPPAVGP